MKKLVNIYKEILNEEIDLDGLVDNLFDMTYDYTSNNVIPGYEKDIDGSNFSVRDFDYELHDKNNVLIYLPIDKFLDKFSDLEGLDVRNKKYQIGDRVAKAKDFINKKINKRNFISIKPTIAYYEDGKLKIADGRHRVIALKELGFNEVGVEISPSQLGIFKKTFKI